MSTVTTRRKAQAAQTSVSTLDLSILSGLQDQYTLYGVSTPLYRILQTAGLATPANTLDDAFNSTDEAKAGLKAGQMGFQYSEKYDGFSMAVKVGEGIMYASIQHDKDGNPLELAEFKLCEVEVVRDFFIPGQEAPILRKGDRFLKVLDPAYKGA